jgi:hypothetical protein
MTIAQTAVAVCDQLIISSYAVLLLFYALIITFIKFIVMGG